MDFKGSYSIPAPPSEVWTALHDPDVLSACIPGAEAVTRLSDTDYHAVATVKVGPVKARFQAKVRWADAPPPDGVTHAGVLSGEGQGGPVGFARGEATVMLSSSGPGTTVLVYEARATIGGKLAQIGQRLIDSTAKALADEFFGAFASRMRDTGGSSAGMDNGPERVAVERNDPVPEPGLKPQLWIVGLIGVIFILLALFILVL